MSKSHEYLLRLDEEFAASPEGYGCQLRLDFAQILWRRLNELGWTTAQFAEKVGWDEEFAQCVLHATEDCGVDMIGATLHTLEVRARLLTEDLDGDSRNRRRG